MLWWLNLNLSHRTDDSLELRSITDGHSESERIETWGKLIDHSHARNVQNNMLVHPIYDPQRFIDTANTPWAGDLRHRLVKLLQVIKVEDNSACHMQDTLKIFSMPTIQGPNSLQTLLMSEFQSAKLYTDDLYSQTRLGATQPFMFSFKSNTWFDSSCWFVIFEESVAKKERK